jgi:hypothetical protein
LPKYSTGEGKDEIVVKVKVKLGHKSVTIDQIKHVEGEQFKEEDLIADINPATYPLPPLEVY